MTALAQDAPLPESDSVAALAALRDLGRTAMTRGDDALAASCWHVVRRLSPADPWAGHNHALCLMRAGRLDEAERGYLDQSESFPDFMPSWRGRAQLAALQGNPEAALAHYEQALALAPDHFETRLDCARQALALGRFEAARTHFTAAATLNPRDPRLAELAEIWLRRGETALRDARYEDALADLAAAPETPRALHARASAFLALARHAEAESCLKAVLDLDPADAASCAALARCAAKAGRIDEAIRLWLRAAALDPNNPWPRNDLGHFAVDHGRLALAETQFRLTLRRRSGFFHALRGLARVAKARGDRKAALAAFLRAAEADPADPWIVNEIASLEAALGQPGAADRLRRLLAERPDFTAARQTLARLTADPAEALTLLEAASAAHPGDDWLRFETARARRACGDPAGAEALLRDLAQGGPAEPAARLDLYHALRERGEDAEAAEWLQQSLLACPADPGLLISQASRLIAESRLDEAQALYEDLARRDLAPYWRRIGMAALARRRGLVAQARQALDEALCLDPLEPAAYAELCALAQADAESQALQTRLDAWIASAPRLYAARAQKARFASQRCDPASALAEWREISRLWPENPEPFIEMARECERLGDAPAALEALAQAAGLDPHHPALKEAQARQAEWRDDIETARAHISDALALAPGRRWLRPQLARLTFMAGRAGEAFAILDRFPADPELEFQRIEMLRQTGRLAEAAAASRAAQARFDAHFRLLWQGACLSADLGRFDEAAEAIARACPANRFETSGVAFLRGYVAMAQWDFAGARAHLETARRANPEDGWALNRLIHCDLLLFDMDAARAGLQALARLNRSLNQIKGKSTAWSQTHYGQLYDEFRLDAQALAATSQALKLPDDDARLAALRQCVRDFPHYTPAAMAALIACRRAGVLKPDSASPAAQAIPSTLAQFWDAAEPPADLAPYFQSWPAHNPGLAYRRFDAASAEAALARLPSRAALSAFRRAEQPAMRADIFRLALLQAEGGAYADADDSCQSSLAPLAAGASLTVYQEDLGSIGNNFLMASPGHPVIARALEDAARAVDEGAADLLWLATGPGALTRALAAYLFEDEAGWRERLAGVRILDRHEMLAHVAIHCHSQYKTTVRHWSRTAFSRALKAPKLQPRRENNGVADQA